MKLRNRMQKLKPKGKEIEKNKSIGKKKRWVPLWLLIAIDIAFSGAYVGGFYTLYYLTPRTLSSSGITTTNTSTSSVDSTSVDVTTSAASASNATTSTSDVIADDASSDTTSASTTDTSTSASSDATSSDTTSATTTTSWAEKFADKFTDTVVTTDSSYTSSDISISVEKYTTGSGDDTVTYYVADIYVADITCIQSGLADGTYGVGYTQDVLDMDSDLNAILAINGDYYGNGSDGVVIRNGEVYRTDTNGSDVCVLYYDGTMKTFSADEFDVEEAIADGAYQAWCFGPELLSDSGSALTSFTADGHVSEINPRSAIGYYEPGHYCLVVVDGRQSGYSKGMTLTELSSLFEDLGCTAAYNLDGGKSSEMTFNDSYVNQPADGGREVSDCIYLKEAD